MSKSSSGVRFDFDLISETKNFQRMAFTTMLPLFLFLEFPDCLLACLSLCDHLLSRLIAYIISHLSLPSTRYFRTARHQQLHHTHAAYTYNAHDNEGLSPSTLLLRPLYLGCCRYLTFIIIFPFTKGGPCIFFALNKRLVYSVRRMQALFPFVCFLARAFFLRLFAARFRNADGTRL